MSSELSTGQVWGELRGVRWVLGLHEGRVIYSTMRGGITRHCLVKTFRRWCSVSGARVRNNA